MLLTNYPAGWTCELIVVRLERYLVSTLLHRDALAVAEHLEACAWCAERLATLRPMSGGAAAESHKGPHDRRRPSRAPAGEAGDRPRGGNRKRHG
jgi:anti-sigma factor RsiW